MLNIVLFGPPGAGKGTQSENLINKYGLVHLSTGDLLRSEIAAGSELGKRAKEVMARGELVGDEIVIGMIETKLDDNQNAKGFIFDGFPRTAAQAVALDDLLQKKGTGISGMLALEVDDEELVKRLIIRGQASGRADDRDEDVIRRRIVEYNTKTLPLKNYYHEQGKFHSINGIGTVDQIFKLLIDRIIFLVAETDLTALETDLEHLDLTIQDFDVANDIAPELLLEIDAIKRAEAEEEEELKEMKKVAKAKLKPKPTVKAVIKKATKKNIVTAKKIKTAPKKTSKKVAKKVAVKTKDIAKKKTKATKVKPLVKKAVKKATKKVVAKAPVKNQAAKQKKVLIKKPVKKNTKRTVAKLKVKKSKKRK